MKIYVVGSSKNKFFPLDNIREKFLIDEKHNDANIDFLNPWYSELTGLYHLWLNNKDDVVGLEHYRTGFWKDGHQLTETDIDEMLKTSDIIVGGFNYPIWNSPTLMKDLERNEVTKPVLGEFLNTVKEYDPEFYKCLIAYLNDEHFYACNLFVGRRQILDEWCSFIFPLLTTFEQKCKIGPNTYKTFRREGFFAEFLFGAWIKYKNLKITECRILKYNHALDKVELDMKGTHIKLQVMYEDISSW